MFNSIIKGIKMSYIYIHLVRFFFLFQQKLIQIHNSTELTGLKSTPSSSNKCTFNNLRKIMLGLHKIIKAILDSTSHKGRLGCFFYLTY